jgi:mono/diheme cytochrome c family protein
MKSMHAILVLILLGAAGCGGKSAENAASTSSSSSGSGTALVSKYDSGPRAGEQEADKELAKAGEQLFKDKGCSACHAFGTKMSGPDLAGVSMRRTAQWMENQILHPEVMVKEDPISRELMGTYALQMPNQGLTPEQARSVIEYLKHRDHEASEGASAAAEDAEKKGD